MTQNREQRGPRKLHIFKCLCSIQDKFGAPKTKCIADSGPDQESKSPEPNRRRRRRWHRSCAAQLQSFFGGALGEDFIRLSSIDFLCGIIYCRSFISESPALTTVHHPAVAKGDHGKVLDGSCIGIVTCSSSPCVALGRTIFSRRHP